MPSRTFGHTGDFTFLFSLGAAEERKGQGTYSLLLSIEGYLGSERIFWKPEKDLNCKNIRAFLFEGIKIFMGSLGKWTNSWMRKTSGDWELFLEASVWIKHDRGKVQADLWVSGKGSPHPPHLHSQSILIRNYCQFLYSQALVLWEEWPPRYLITISHFCFKLCWQTFQGMELETLASGWLFISPTSSDKTVMDSQGQAWLRE